MTEYGGIETAPSRVGMCGIAALVECGHEPGRLAGQLQLGASERRTTNPAPHGLQEPQLMGVWCKLCHHIHRPKYCLFPRVLRSNYLDEFWNG